MNTNNFSHSKTKRTKGDYVKAIGGDFGLFWNGQKWISFQCLGCEIARGNVVPSQRISLGDVPQLKSRVGYNFESKHDIELHRRWFDSGKPASIKW